MKQSAHTALHAALALLLACILAVSAIQMPVSADGAITPEPVAVGHSDRNYPWLERSTETYLYDFTRTDILTYSQDAKLATASLRTNMVFADGKLSCKPGKTFSFGSAVFLGDDYGLAGGDLSFRLALTGDRLAPAEKSCYRRTAWSVVHLRAGWRDRIRTEKRLFRAGAGRHPCRRGDRKAGGSGGYPDAHP